MWHHHIWTLWNKVPLEKPVYLHKWLGPRGICCLREIAIFVGCTPPRKAVSLPCRLPGWMSELDRHSPYIADYDNGWCFFFPIFVTSIIIEGYKPEKDDEKDYKDHKRDRRHNTTGVIPVESYSSMAFFPSFLFHISSQNNQIARWRKSFRACTF